MNVKPGSRVSIEILKTPTSESARKTLDRICRTDATVRKAIRTRKAKRPSHQTWRRGGRFWNHRMQSVSPVKLEKGSTYTVLTTVPLVRDLASVARWVKVQPA